MHFLETKLSAETAPLSKGFEAVCLFVEDDTSAPVLEILYENGVRFIALRSDGYNNVDKKKAKELLTETQVVNLVMYMPPLEKLDSDFMNENEMA
jgi:lactate dehydrogenase-like 2-hydroxyacid dehydrogenase